MYAFYSNSKRPMKKILTYSLIGLIVFTIGIYFRFAPLLRTDSKESRDKASLLVINNIRTNIKNTIIKQNPEIEKTELQLATKQAFDIYISKNRHKVHGLIKNLSSKLSTDKGYPYLLASDSYYYYDLTQNIVSSGKLADQKLGSKYLNTKMLSPKGHWEPINMHPYVGFVVYKIIAIFDHDISLMKAVRFVPLIIFGISLILFLLICNNLNLSPPATFACSIFFSLAPIFVKRSALGWYDNDPYNILFPLLLMVFLFYGFSNITNKTKSIIFAVLAAFSFAAYSLFWHGWMFIFVIILSSLLLCIAYSQLFKKETKTTKTCLRTIIIICGIGFSIIALIFELREIAVLFQEGLTALKNFSKPQLSIWPNIYISVGELKNASFKFISIQSGGKIFFAISILGMISSLFSLFINNNNNKAVDKIPFQIITLIVFCFLSIFITLGAERFVIFCIVPLSLLFGLGLQNIQNIIISIINKFSQQKKFLEQIGKAIIYLTIISLTYLPIRNMSAASPYLMNYIFNKTWEDTLTQIKERTPENSTIYTWWPPGHFIKAIADRKVVFDGATINVPQAYWMANVFLSETEEDALGILRMINSSGNDAFDYLHKELQIPASISIDALKAVIPLSKNDAALALVNSIKKPKIVKNIIKLTHNNPTPGYCLLYNEFVENNLQLGFFGKWDFKKIETINQNPQLLEKIPKTNSSEYIKFLWQLVGGPYRYSGPLEEISRKEDVIFFEQNVQVDIKKLAIQVASKKYGKGQPFSIFYFDEKKQKIIEKISPKSNLPFSAILVKDNNKWTCVLLERQLAKSLLVKLYFFNAKGLKYFETFIENSDLTNQTKIKVYRINWEKFTESKHRK